MRTTVITTIALIAAFSFAASASALTVSPTRIEIRGNPGQTLKGEMEIYNEQQEGKTFYTSFENFESRGDTGAPYFIGNKDGLATWMTSDAKIEIATGERVKVPFTITIPQSAKPGGYFAAEFFGTEQPKSGNPGDVSIGGKVGVLVLLSVNGDVEQAAGLSGFSGKGAQRFFTMLPVTLEYVFNNKGGDRVVPKGDIVIKNSFRSITAKLLANEREGSVLPGSPRRFSVAWGNEVSNEERGFFSLALLQLSDFHFGWYTADLSLAWGDVPQTAVATYHFFVFPWQLMVCVFLVIVVLRFILLQYKKNIIAAATNQK
ncbi:MAG TPA: hypothetical protein VJ579_02770 [Candidatus Paceibacterota bacterium]|nr:hypothetical protein [Candidatus Paceibacterota bacterium]